VQSSFLTFFSGPFNLFESCPFCVHTYGGIIGSDSKGKKKHLVKNDPTAPEG